MVLVTLVHFIACARYGLGQSSGELGWVHELGGTPAEDDFFFQYMICVYWSMTQFTGTLETMPKTAGEQIFAVTVHLAAFLIAASIISNLTSSMTKLNMIAGKEASMFAMLREYLVDKGISRKLTMKVQRNAEYAVQKCHENYAEEDVQLLQMISEPL